MAKAVGVSPSSVGRIWAKVDLKPHPVKIFEASNGLKFAEKATDLIGRYLNSWDRAVVLCVEEKSQI